MKAGAQVLYLDYCGLIAPSDPRAPTWEQASEVSHSLKNLARGLNVPVVGLVQLNRQATDGAGLETIRGSGSYEEDSDLVLILKREGEAEPGAETIQGSLQIAKARNGPTGFVKLLFNTTTTRFIEDTR